MTRKKRLVLLLNSPVDFKECRPIWRDIETAAKRKYRISKERLEILYASVRAAKPQIMVETGVARGASSWALLEAMRNNGAGSLHSIDIGMDDFDVGYLVPQALRRNWELVIEDSKTALPKMLERLGTIDVFFHDSLHTYDHMMFEFETSLPYLTQGGLIMADDTELNTSFSDFCRKHQLQYQQFYGFSVAKV